MQYLHFHVLWCFHWEQTENMHENRWVEIALSIKLDDKQYAGGSKKKKKKTLEKRKKEMPNNSKALSFDIPEYGKVHTVYLLHEEREMERQRERNPQCYYCTRYSFIS